MTNLEICRALDENSCVGCVCCLLHLLCYPENVGFELRHQELVKDPRAQRYHGGEHPVVRGVRPVRVLEVDSQGVVSLRPKLIDWCRPPVGEEFVLAHLCTSMARRPREIVLRVK